MANYCSRFIQSYATLTQPPRELTQEDRTWGWMARHDQAQLKGALANVPVTAYNDPDKDTEIRVDTSPIDLGAIPAQTYPDSGNQQVVVAYASRSLSDMEQRYSQNEREALAVVWVCEYFHLYAYGKSITVHRDHNALLLYTANLSQNHPHASRGGRSGYSPTKSLWPTERVRKTLPTTYRDILLDRHQLLADKKESQRSLWTTSPAHRHQKRLDSKI